MSANTLPPIGCNGRGAQASSLEAPVSLAEPTVREQFRLVKDSGAFDYFDRLPSASELPAYLACAEEFQLPVHTASWFYALGRDEPLLAEKLGLNAAATEDQILAALPAKPGETAALQAALPDWAAPG